MTIKLTDKIAISPQAVARQVGDETIILHIRSGTYFGLDPVGARIWYLMEEGKTLAEICNTMLNEYEVSREELERDAVTLVRELLARDLVSQS